MLCFGLQGHRTYYKRSTVFFHNSSFLRKINSDPIWMTERQQFSGTWTLPEYMSFKLLHASWCTIFFTATITSYFLDFTHKPCQKQFIVNAFTNTSVSFGSSAHDIRSGVFELMYRRNTSPLLNASFKQQVQSKKKAKVTQCFPINNRLEKHPFDASSSELRTSRYKPANWK